VTRLTLSLLFSILLHTLTYGEDYVVTADTTNIYDGETIIAQLPQGAKFSSDEVNGEWVHIKHISPDGLTQNGWVNIKAIQLAADTVTEQAEVKLYLYRKGEASGPYSITLINWYLENDLASLEDYARRVGSDQKMKLKHFDLTEDGASIAASNSVADAIKIIYLYKHGREKGPYSIDEITSMLEAGEIALDNEARIEGEKKRLTLREVYSRIEEGPLEPVEQKKGLAKKVLLGFAKILGGFSTSTGGMGTYSAVSSDAGNAKLLLYGGYKRRRFMGCLNCDKSDESSVWNKSGEFGSETGRYSIWNKSGSYGGKYKEYSPWKKFSSMPPVILDKNRNFYGEFTIDRFSRTRTRIEWIVWILENEDYVRENFDEIASEI